MDVPFAPSWLSWVGATTACLRALGVECDQGDVAGMSGYGFLLTIHEGLCPSGPTVIDWGALLPGIAAMGRSTLVFNGGQCGGSREQARFCYDFVERELKANRPCVIWGPYVPEFAVAVGVEGGTYVVRSFRECVGQPQPPVPWDQLQTPGQIYALALPTPSITARATADRNAICHAVEMMRRCSASRAYRFGLDGYDLWITALNHPEQIDPVGNAYNAQCWAEARALAATFIARVADRDPIMGDALRAAHKALDASADSLKRVAELFAFPGHADQLTPDNRRTAIQALAQAKASDSKALEALAHAAEV